MKIILWLLPLVIPWTDLCFTRQVNATRRNDTEVVRELVARGAPIEFASTPQDGEDFATGERVWCGSGFRVQGSGFRV